MRRLKTKSSVQERLKSYRQKLFARLMESLRIKALILDTPHGHQTAPQIVAMIERTTARRDRRIQQLWELSNAAYLYS